MKSHPHGEQCGRLKSEWPVDLTRECNMTHARNRSELHAGERDDTFDDRWNTLNLDNNVGDPLPDYGDF